MNNTLSPQPYKGTRDYYPADKAVQNYIFGVWRDVVQSFGYQEYGTPLLEPLEVYMAKSGDELAGEQTYAFRDRGDRLVAIRPEMTPSVSRLVAAKRQELAYPARLFSVANFMRYERPQRGREREFWQLNVDMFGADGAVAEAEIISLADRLIKAFGAREDMYEIKVNNRKLINFVMSSYLGLDEAGASAMVRLLDRKNKLPTEVFDEQARQILDKDENAYERLQVLLNASTMAELPDSILASSATAEIRTLFTLLDKLNITSVVFDITLMRGLDYYTGTVFEVFDKHPDNNRSMFGGGRYDGLVGLFGVDPVSAVGFAPGLTTTELFLRSHNLLPSLDVRSHVYIIPIGDNQAASLVLAEKIRESGLIVEVDVTERKLDKQIKTANKKNAVYVLFVGDEEVAQDSYKVKRLATGEEFTLTSGEFAQLV